MSWLRALGWAVWSVAWVVTMVVFWTQPLDGWNTRFLAFIWCLAGGTWFLKSTLFRHTAWGRK